MGGGGCHRVRWVEGCGVGLSRGHPLTSLCLRRIGITFDPPQSAVHHHPVVVVVLCVRQVGCEGGGGVFVWGERGSHCLLPSFVNTHTHH